MSQLPRPHIPISVRVHVATRQLYEIGINAGLHARREGEPLSSTLARMLTALFGDQKVELHHRPALVNRRRKRNGEYDPPANDPAHLVYLPEADHDVETRVRGQRGQHSDLGLRRKAKNIAKNRDPKRRKVKIRSANRWPPKGSQKIRNRIKR